MKVAIIHDWLTTSRGGEKCLEVFCELFPDADIYTLLHIPGACSGKIEKMKIHTSFIQRFPFLAEKYRSYLPFFPFAIERFNLKGYDLVISSSHCVAKGIIPPPDALHICYIYTPMRYIWDMFDDYFGEEKTGTTARNLISSISSFLRVWDVSSSSRVDRFIAISNHVRKRVEKYYRREAEILYPPADTRFFEPGGEKGDYFLVVSSLVPYKRVELAVEACNRLQRPLLVIGAGPEGKRLRSLARFSGIKFLGHQGDEALKRYYQSCRALIFPGEEDFGIVPVEAMACGRPVIAYGRGGALETVISPGSGRPITGIHFMEQDTESLIKAIGEFEKMEKEFNPAAIRGHAQSFDRDQFKQKLDGLIRKFLGQWQEGKRADVSEAKSGI